MATAPLRRQTPPPMWRAFILFLTVLVQLVRAVCKSRDELVLENLALRQQVTALNLGKGDRKNKQPIRSIAALPASLDSGPIKQEQVRWRLCGPGPAHAPPLLCDPGLGGRL